MREDNERTVPFEWSDLYALWVMAYEAGYKEGYFDNENEKEFRSPAYHNLPEFLKKMFIDYKRNDEGIE